MAKILACLALLCLAAGGDAEDSGILKRGNKEGKLFFGSYRTVTRTGFTLTTSTVYASCLSGLDLTKLCTGRKKRNVFDLATIPDEEVPDLVDSSMNENPQLSNREGSSNPTGKLNGLYTIWTTSTTSTTVTYKYTDDSTTISLSYYCTVGGAEYPEQACG